MGLLDGLLEGVAGKFLGGEGSNPLLGMVGNLLSGSQGGGLSGLIQSFNSKGLGDIFFLGWHRGKPPHLGPTNTGGFGQRPDTTDG